MNAPILKVENLQVHFPVAVGGIFIPTYKPLRAVDGISFELAAGETLGIVGESGCGKSTLGRAIIRLIEPTGGRVVWFGEDLAALDEKALRAKRQDLQIIFQSPLASLNPRMTVGRIIGEPLEIFHPEMTADMRRAEVANAMAVVGLDIQSADRYPHEFSGGQCQRISIARAMILKPKLLVCDEAVSALDVSVKAQIINLLKDIQKETGVALLFISHDLAVVRNICKRVMVMFLGKVMEIGDTRQIFDAPQHPYTRALLNAIPLPDPRAERERPAVLLNDELPSPLNPPSGCVFRTRCPLATPHCIHEAPELVAKTSDHRTACHYAGHDLPTAR
ncbi:ABC transporter ATP-binding protein [Govanella unica]|uniref:ATP-binding cassette domain-containing protein n=1 Tax=Govanella unica TaxID=2975056 RepID=A0A9X3Z6D9_9PROT|nr:oligopeptide/dipeptide ABC transporter ATP-binding protein [Govania unica]MDA5192903.1 ATP-binding cassette domain-containing protein [Govania unica]